jgi:hypothetical protein
LEGSLARRRPVSTAPIIQGAFIIMEERIVVPECCIPVTITRRPEISINFASSSGHSSTIGAGRAYCFTDVVTVVKRERLWKLVYNKTTTNRTKKKRYVHTRDVILVEAEAEAWNTFYFMIEILFAALYRNL